MQKIFLALFILFLGCVPSRGVHQSINELKYPDDLYIIKRADWGWIPIDTTFKTQTIKYITIHHGGVKFKNDEDPVEDIRNLQSWSQKEKHWIDIPYHFMISPDGRIFETRPINIPGDTNTEYDPTGHALVEVMGNFDIQQFGPKQYDSMIKLIKFLQKSFDVPVSRIKTHRDYSKITVCPGKNVYKLFTDGTVEKALTE